jgi:hypothetical protein
MAAAAHRADTKTLFSMGDLSKAASPWATPEGKAVAECSHVVELGNRRAAGNP